MTLLDRLEQDHKPPAMVHVRASLERAANCFDLPCHKVPHSYPSVWQRKILVHEQLCGLSSISFVDFETRFLFVAQLGLVDERSQCDVVGLDSD